MTGSSSGERFARLGRSRAVDPVPFGSPAVVALRPGPDLRAVSTISAMIALARRRAPLEIAKRAVEEALEIGRAVLALPTLDEARALSDEITAAGMRVAVMAPEHDVGAVRAELGLSRDQFAIRYGLDPELLAAWEEGRDAPDRAVLSYLKVIRHMPLQASEALEGAPV